MEFKKSSMISVKNLRIDFSQTIIGKPNYSMMAGFEVD